MDEKQQKLICELAHEIMLYDTSIQEAEHKLLDLIMYREKLGKAFNEAIREGTK